MNGMYLSENYILAGRWRRFCFSMHTLFYFLQTVDPYSTFRRLIFGNEFVMIYLKKLPTHVDVCTYIKA